MGGPRGGECGEGGGEGGLGLWGGGDPRAGASDAGARGGGEQVVWGARRAEPRGGPGVPGAGWPEIQRLGNAVDPATGARAAVFQAAARLGPDEAGTYDPARRVPVWHTDQLFRVPQPVGSLLHCRAAPPEGGRTLFASTTAAYAALDAPAARRVGGLVAVASYAHHNAKIRRASPLNTSFPLLTADQRRRFPPVALPLAAAHPDTGAVALNCFSSAVFAVVAEGDPLLDAVRGAQAGDADAMAALDAFEVDGEEHPSVEAVLRRWLLPHATAPEAIYAHAWEPGDFVVWDNRCTVHAPTGFDAERFQREMWRTTFASGPPPGEDAPTVVD